MTYRLRYTGFGFIGALIFIGCTPVSGFLAWQALRSPPVGQAAPLAPPVERLFAIGVGLATAASLGLAMMIGGRELRSEAEPD